MPIPVICSDCKARFNLADRLLGKKVRCAKCGSIIKVEEAPEDDAIAERPSSRVNKAPLKEKTRPARDEVDDEEDDRPRRPRDRDDDEDDDRPRPRRRKRERKGFPVLPVVLGGVLLLFLVCAGGGAFLYMSGLFDDLTGDWPDETPLGTVPPGVGRPAGAPQFASNEIVRVHVSGVVNEYTADAVGSRLGRFVDPGRGSAMTSNKKGDKMTFLVAPVSDPQAFADRIDCGTVKRVSGRTVTMVANKVEGPGADADEETKLAFDLRSSSMNLRMQAFHRLRSVKPGPHQKEVADALVSLLDSREPFAPKEASDALEVWAMPEHVPAILQYLKKEEPLGHGGAVKALGRFKDPQALEQLLEMLGNFFDKKNAAEAIKGYGSSAEKAVLARFTSEDEETIGLLCEILREIGTKESVPTLQQAAAQGQQKHWHRVPERARDAINAIQRRGQ